MVWKLALSSFKKLVSFCFTLLLGNSLLVSPLKSWCISLGHSSFVSWIQIFFNSSPTILLKALHSFYCVSTLFKLRDEWLQMSSSLLWTPGPQNQKSSLTALEDFQWLQTYFSIILCYLCIYIQMEGWPKASPSLRGTKLLLLHFRLFNVGHSLCNSYKNNWHLCLQNYGEEDWLIDWRIFICIFMLSQQTKIPKKRGHMTIITWTIT